jgi:hypothetical protein
MPKTYPVRIGVDIIQELQRLKVHRRETYDDVIRRIFEEWKQLKLNYGEH